LAYWSVWLSFSEQEVYHKTNEVVLGGYRLWEDEDGHRGYCYNQESHKTTLHGEILLKGSGLMQTLLNSIRRMQPKGDGGRGTVIVYAMTCKLARN
jgi:hypothetical protein